MLEEQDVQKIIEAMTNVFPTKTDFEYFKDEMHEKFSNLQSSVDGYMKEVKTVREETDVISSKVTRHDRWIRHVADKAEVELVS